MLSVHSSEIRQCDRATSSDWIISCEESADMHGPKITAGVASTPSVSVDHPKAATVAVRPSVAESAERVQKLAEQSSVGTGLETMPIPNGRASPQ